MSMRPPQHGHGRGSTHGSSGDVDFSGSGAFNRIRHYGLLANGNRAANIAKARALLAMPAPVGSTCIRNRRMNSCVSSVIVV